LSKKNTPPTIEELLDWLEGRSSEEEAQRVAAYVATAEGSVQADVAWLRNFLEISRSTESVEPPAILTERLERRFAALARDRRPPSLRERLIATLQFDSGMSLARGVRATAATSHQRQFLFETTQATVICTVQRREDDLVDLLGQVLPEAESEAELTRVSLLKENLEFDSTITDDLGEFTLNAIPYGQYDMVLDSVQYEIMIPSIDLSL
jgi:hypothetical protein